VYEASRAVKIPIVGLGGIEKPEDVLEYMVVGASATQVGTANFSDPKACETIVSGLSKECIKNKIFRISSLVANFSSDFA
jgi:dihydroorotate dehydrogenase (NAD+) catalytic subunit